MPPPSRFSNAGASPTHTPICLASRTNRQNPAIPANPPHIAQLRAIPQSPCAVRASARYSSPWCARVGRRRRPIRTPSTGEHRPLAGAHPPRGSANLRAAIHRRRPHPPRRRNLRVARVKPLGVAPKSPSEGDQTQRRATSVASVANRIRLMHRSGSPSASGPAPRRQKDATLRASTTRGSATACDTRHSVHQRRAARQCHPPRQAAPVRRVRLRFERHVLRAARR